MSTRPNLRSLSTAALLATLAVTATGCFTTKVHTKQLQEAADAPIRDRQWFLLGGLVNLSDPAGMECEKGVAGAESELAGLDIAINVALSVAGAVAGSALCDENQPGCAASNAGSLLPFLFGSRTVEYRCLR